jgi:oligoribonuclease NrnB/cAMP/cGMP phosphodiesterase (DHH superfamily)
MEQIRKICNPFDIDIVIFHHVCMDGFAAAFVAKLFLYEFNETLEFIPKSLDGKPLDVKNFKDKNILMVDIVCENFKEIKENCNSLIILDHHKTNQDKLAGIDYAYFDMNKSGVGLAWQYFYNTEMPLFLECIQDRDLWTWKNEKSRNFCDGLYELMDFSNYEFTIFCKLYQKHKLNNTDMVEFDKYYELGNTLNIVKSKNIHGIVKYNSVLYLATIDKKEYKIYIYNVSHNIASDLGNYVMENLDCDFVVLWRYNHNDELYNYSLRSVNNKTDVSNICKIHGGGGHHNAAGFSHKDPPKVVFNYEKINL